MIALILADKSPNIKKSCPAQLNRSLGESKLL
jgi:hypothetical protein